jgi:ABC-type sugar transport system permease subunit
MFTVAGILGASGPILLFTNGNYGTTTLSFWIFSQVVYSGNSELPAALGLMMTLLSLPLVFTVRHFAKKRELY